MLRAVPDARRDHAKLPSARRTDRTRVLEVRGFADAIEEVVFDRELDVAREIIRLAGWHSRI